MNNPPTLAEFNTLIELLTFAMLAGHINRAIVNGKYVQRITDNWEYEMMSYL